MPAVVEIGDTQNKGDYAQQVDYKKQILHSSHLVLVRSKEFATNSKIWLLYWVKEWKIHFR